MKPIDIVCELKALEHRIIKSEIALAEVSSNSLLDCADWHDAEAKRLRRFVVDYPRGDRITGIEATQLDLNNSMANRHEVWARKIREKNTAKEHQRSEERTASDYSTGCNKETP